MTEQPKTNLNNLAMVAAALGELREHLVFVGGAVVDLLITDPVHPGARTTMDVDAVVEVSGLDQYYGLLDQLRAKGFHEDITSGLTCRWRKGEMVLDLMTADGTGLGFSNRWYRSACQNAVSLSIAGLQIKVISAPDFLATKLEAFRDRGGFDYMASHDLEDFITLVDGREELITEVKKAPVNLREFLAKSCQQLLGSREFGDNLAGHLPPDSGSQGRVPIVLERLKAIADLP